jgi:CrcB protein
MERFLIICASGAAGTGVRYLVGLWAGQRFGPAFPYGTMIVNVAGCFLIALVMQLSVSVVGFPPNLRFALTTGFMGGLTTYSSFNYETTKLLEDGSYTLAAANLLVTLAACAVAGLLGLLLARRLAGG